MSELATTLLASPYSWVALAAGYVLGSTPFGLIFTRMAGLGDVRAVGSGNIGATNVLRMGNGWVAAATLLGDVFKGTAAVLLAGSWSPFLGLIAGFGAFLGHLYPFWLKFNGGKGVATFIGVLMALSWQAVLVFALVWLSLAALVRYSSLASLMASLSAPIVFYFIGATFSAITFALMTLILWIKHRQNISRLLTGQESKIGQKS